MYDFSSLDGLLRIILGYWGGLIITKSLYEGLERSQSNGKPAPGGNPSAAAAGGDSLNVSLSLNSLVASSSSHTPRYLYA